jgi:hypothetical protein
MVGVRRSERNNQYSNAAAISNFSEFDVHQIAYFLEISVRMNNFIFLAFVPRTRADFGVGGWQFLVGHISTYTTLLPAWNTLKAF